ncbi:substrate-binding periplasmic protein [Maridesulfovibrio frigidus]|uniref:substrate-binding periplasmic protein n=1 Tax=Maridesulfovibrio frigidus TaxID=340956 RepID=UPI0004E0E392|nr:transporter substrate-binding domain-containing protein [Maridesulfovibrio frigidus]
MKIVLSLLAIFLLSLAGQSRASQELLLITDPFPPYNYEEDGKAYGIQYELVAATLKKMDRPFTIKFVPWKRALLKAKNKVSDALPGVLKTDERSQWLIFPEEPVMITKVVIFHRKEDNFQYKNLSSLTGKRVGTVKGYYYGEEFDQSTLFIRDEVSSLKQNFQKLIAGRIDLVVAFKPVGLYTLYKLNRSDKVSYNPTPVYQSGMYMAFTQKPGNEQLAAEFSRILKEIKKTPGYVKSLRKKYIPNE